MQKKIFLFLFLFFLSVSSSVAFDGERKVQVSLLSDVESVQPGKAFNIGIYFKIEKGWHTYYKDPGEAGAPPQFKWSLPKGFKIEELQWPKPLKLVEPGNIRVNAYKNELFLWAKVLPPKNISSKKIKIDLEANWLVCEKLCIPENGTASLTLPVNESTPIAANQPIFEKYQKQSSGFDSQIWKFLFFAFIGGLILNVMPCVLPVISLKILSFVKMAQKSQKKVAALGFSFTAGVLFSFIFLAVFVVVFKSLGQNLGWGFQFQHPGFVIALTSIIFVLGLSLGGLFELTLNVPQKGTSLTEKEGLGGAFFHGVLATILATPCTAPFVGVTIGFAFSSSSFNIFLIFISMGLGLASPFLILALNPAWTRWIPKPGPWMIAFKQLMSFLLFATAVWLLWVIGRQSNTEGVVFILAFLVCLGLASWIWGKVQFLERQKRIFWGVALIVFLLISGKIFVQPVLDFKRTDKVIEAKEGKINWLKYNPDQFQQFLKEGKPVFLDFTADWCLTCKVNEKRVLNKPEVVEAFSKLGIIPIKLDWTFQDKEVTQLLNSFNRYGVPLYVFYPKGGESEPILLPEVLTKGIVLDTIGR